MSNFDVLVISPHADDAILSMGGTIARYINNDETVLVCIITKPWTPKWTQDWIDRYFKEVTRAYNILHAKTLQLDFDATTMAHEHDVPIFEKASTVYIPHPHDYHSDHRAIMSALLPYLTPKDGVRELYAYETVSETEWGTQPFHPNLYIDITSYLNTKLRAVKAFTSELRPSPHPRRVDVVEALATKRGSEAMVKFAEAFHILRDIR